MVAQPAGPDPGPCMHWLGAGGAPLHAGPHGGAAPPQRVALVCVSGRRHAACGASRYLHSGVGLVQEASL